MGRPRTLTDAQEREIYAWYLEWQRQGLYKRKAAQLGITVSTLKTVLERLRRDALRRVA